MGEEPPVTDVQQEEDKAKMLLGAKLLVGVFCYLLRNKYSLYDTCNYSAALGLGCAFDIMSL